MKQNKVSGESFDYATGETHHYSLRLSDAEIAEKIAALRQGPIEDYLERYHACYHRSRTTKKLPSDRMLKRMILLEADQDLWLEGAFTNEINRLCEKDD